MTAAPRHYLLEATLEPEGQRLLDLIYSYLVKHGDWPVLAEFSRPVFKELHFDLGQAVGRLHLFAQTQTVESSESYDKSRVVLKFAGLVRVPAAAGDVKLCVRVLRYLGKRALDEKNKRESVTFGEVIDALKINDKRFARFAMLVWADRMVWPLTSGCSMKPDRGLAFRLSPQQMAYADIKTGEDALAALSPPLPDLIEWPRRDSPIGFLHDMVAHLDWAKREDVAHHLQSAEKHHQERRWDDCAVQLRKAFEQLLIDFSTFTSASRKESIPAKQKPNTDDRLKYLVGRAVLRSAEHQILIAAFQWLSDRGAHPGIPDEIEGESKWMVGTELLRLFLTRAVNMPSAV